MKLMPALSAYLVFMRLPASLSVLRGQLEQGNLYMVRMPLPLFSHEKVATGIILVMCLAISFVSKRWLPAWRWLFQNALASGQPAITRR